MKTQIPMAKEASHLVESLLNFLTPPQSPADRQLQEFQQSQFRTGAEFAAEMLMLQSSLGPKSSLGPNRS